MSKVPLSVVLARIAEECERAGSLRAFARKIKVSPAYVSDVLHERREPGDAILAPLGLDKRVVVTRTVEYFKVKK